jgi:hypothetical protein
MLMKLRLPYATALILAAIQGAVSAQWLEYPTRALQAIRLRPKITPCTAAVPTRSWHANEQRQRDRNDESAQRPHTRLYSATKTKKSVTTGKAGTAVDSTRLHRERLGWGLVLQGPAARFEPRPTANSNHAHDLHPGLPDGAGVSIPVPTETVAVPINRR